MTSFEAKKHKRIKEKMSEEELIINMNFLKDSYPKLTLEDIRLAVKYSLNGTLNVNPEAFGSFSPLYISKIINSYFNLHGDRDYFHVESLLK